MLFSSRPNNSSPGASAQAYSPPKPWNGRALPAAGQWARLAVPASNLGLEGSTLKGMDFALYGGRATWDYAGKSNAGGGSTTVASPPATTNSVPTAISVVSGGAIQFSWPSSAGRNYHVVYKNALSDATWTDLSGAIASTGAAC